MLIIDIPSAVYEKPGSWNGTSKQLIRIPAIHLEMEHSLMSISKWEAKWKIAFMDTPNMTTEQFLDYCRCMTINKQKDLNVYRYLRQKDAVAIRDYMNDPMSARVIRPKKNRSGPKVRMTSEYFYWLMIQHGIPWECEKWHFGRLLALIDCCGCNSGGGEKMSYRERQKLYSTLNDQRRKMLGTKG